MMKTFLMAETYPVNQDQLGNRIYPMNGEYAVVRHLSKEKAKQYLKEQTGGDWIVDAEIPDDVACSFFVKSRGRKK